MMDLPREVGAQEAKKIIGLKTTAYKEYLSARLLVNSHFFQQAGVLMTTCLEKEIKAYLLTRGVSFKWTHDLTTLHKKLKNLSPEICNGLNIEFLTALSNIYKTRYYDQLDPGYNFVFIKNKFLAEFDYCFSILEPNFRIQRKSEINIQKTRYQTDVETRNLKLFQNNYLLNGLDKNAFLRQPELVCEFRIASNHEVLEFQYPIPYNRTEEMDKFLYEGLSQKNNSQFQGSHFGYSKDDFDKLNNLLAGA